MELIKGFSEFLTSFNKVSTLEHVCIRVETVDSGGLNFSKIIPIDIRYRNKPPY